MGNKVEIEIIRLIPSCDTPDKIIRSFFADLNIANNNGDQIIGNRSFGFKTNSTLVDNIITLLKPYFSTEENMTVRIFNKKIKTYHIFEKNSVPIDTSSEHSIEKTIETLINKIATQNIFIYEKTLSSIGQEIKGYKNEKFDFFAEHKNSKYSIAALYLLFLRWVSSNSKMTGKDIGFMQKTLEKPFDNQTESKNKKYDNKARIYDLTAKDSEMLENIDRIEPHKEEIIDILVIAFFSKYMHKLIKLNEINYNKKEAQKYDRCEAIKRTIQRCQIILDLLLLYPKEWISVESINFLKRYIDDIKANNDDATLAMPNPKGGRYQRWSEYIQYHLWGQNYLLTLDDIQEEVGFDKAKTSALLVRPYTVQRDGDDKYTFIPWIKFIKNFSDQSKNTTIKILNSIIDHLNDVGITDACKL